MEENVFFWCSEMINLQQSLVDLCDKAKNGWQKMDPNVAMVTSIDDNCMGINQAICHIAYHLKFQKKVSHYHICLMLVMCILSVLTCTLHV